MRADASEAILRILSGGPGATLQDAGRHGYLRFGVTAAGPMDRWRMPRRTLRSAILRAQRRSKYPSVG
ncbi:hypothetical protein [Bradyrhizobium sp. AUGA SZCCT0240]|uniref:hypothetical protein n=1 Tax=Bradyrhizobium sp. AUGA SZCCT0240 TaxID=2807669 RepID=UPI0028966D4C|nr:hypothetical protein [Bradyrhizobium sp. AUGA SZCCT0240]